MRIIDLLLFFSLKTWAPTFSSIQEVCERVTRHHSDFIISIPLFRHWFTYFKDSYILSSVLLLLLKWILPSASCLYYQRSVSVIDTSFCSNSCMKVECRSLLPTPEACSSHNITRALLLACSPSKLFPFHFAHYWFIICQEL